MTAQGPAGPDGHAMPHEAHLVALASLDGVGPGRMRWLLSLGHPEQVWRRVAGGALPRAPRHLRIDDHMRRQWHTQATSGIDPATAWRRCVDLGVGVVSLGSPGYPPALRDDPDPPVVLFHFGDPDRIASPRVAVIGTRKATGYGIRTAETLGRELTEAGVSVVSGLALGIDAAAHRGAVASKGAAPVAVVGGGLDAPCPARNRRLAAQVADTGVLLTEVPPGVPAAPWRFPVRNRILAALAEVVVVVESGGAGGSMHTVREALARDRPVLAVPGPIDSIASEGANQLLSEGAHPCLSVDDVLVALGEAGHHDLVRRGAATDTRRSAGRPELRPDPQGDAALLLECLGWRPASAEQLALRSGLEFRRLAAALRRLESDGWTVQRDGWIERVSRVPTIPGERPGDA